MEHKAFIIYIAALSIDPSDEVYSSKKSQIAYLKTDKAFTEMPSKYADFPDVFSLKWAMELPEHRINNHAIELMDDLQLFVYCDKRAHDLAGTESL